MEEATKVKDEKEFFLLRKIKNFTEKEPKKSFYMMFGLIFLSVVFSVGNLIYVQKVSIPKYEKMKKENIFKDAATSLGTPIRETEKILDMRDALKELEYYRRKKILTASDSMRIKYLLDKYKLKNMR